jgi:hypothetical protein
MKTYFFSYFFKQKSKQKAFFKFSEDFFHFTALHENHRLHFATCCVPVSAIAVAKAGNALPQMQRLNLGKFRGSGSCELEKLVCNEETTSVEEYFKSYK